MSARAPAISSVGRRERDALLVKVSTCLPRERLGSFVLRPSRNGHDCTSPGSTSEAGLWVCLWRLGRWKYRDNHSNGGLLRNGEQCKARREGESKSDVGSDEQTSGRGS